MPHHARAHTCSKHTTHKHKHAWNELVLPLTNSSLGDKVTSVIDNIHLPLLDCCHPKFVAQLKVYLSSGKSISLNGSIDCTHSALISKSFYGLKWKLTIRIVCSLRKGTFVSDPSVSKMSNLSHQRNSVGHQQIKSVQFEVSSVKINRNKTELVLSKNSFRKTQSIGMKQYSLIDV